MLISVDTLIDRLNLPDDEIPSAKERTNLKERLSGLEIMVRNITNNKFQNRKIRCDETLLFEYDSVNLISTITGTMFETSGFRIGNTVEVIGTTFNDGLYTITALTETEMTVEQEVIDESIYTTIIKIEYPKDIIDGVIKLINYDDKMTDKVGIKSETISRYSVTYYDVNAAEMFEGYPASMVAFLNKYRRIRWD